MADTPEADAVETAPAEDSTPAPAQGFVDVPLPEFEIGGPVTGVLPPRSPDVIAEKGKLRVLRPAEPFTTNVVLAVGDLIYTIPAHGLQVNTSQAAGIKQAASQAGIELTDEGV